jgi:hypothetical protein
MTLKTGQSRPVFFERRRYGVNGSQQQKLEEQIWP